MTRRLRGISKATRLNNKTCSKDKILRKAYVRYSKTGKKRLVKAGCITRRGSNTKTKTRIGPLRHGDLRKYGYEQVISLTETQRHMALSQAVGKYGSLSVWKKLNVLFILHKNTNPELSQTYKKDRDWINNKFGIRASNGYV